MDVLGKMSLSGDGLIRLVRKGFKRIADHRAGVVKILLADALSAAFAMFSLKHPSLLSFDRQRNDPNLQSVYHIGQVPCDTQMREILDGVDPENLRPLFKDVFRQLQRSKKLESFVYFKGCYLLSIDGTSYFSSKKIHCESCLEKHHKNGTISYHHQMLGAAIVHPDHREVIPLAPEPIIKQDGASKNDCERNACKRFMPKFRNDHPHLKVIVIEDGLASNGPHIQDLMTYNCHFILGAKEGDHPSLFEALADGCETGETGQYDKTDADGTLHQYLYRNGVPLNASHPELLVNVLDYWQQRPNGKSLHFSWVTDLELTLESIEPIMRGGRCRWKIENETFNTLKNQDYKLEHNFGHGEQNLSVVFAQLMMLGFLVDQAMQIGCKVFDQAHKKVKTKTALWQGVRNLFFSYLFESITQIHEALAIGFVKQPLKLASRNPLSPPFHDTS